MAALRRAQIEYNNRMAQKMYTHTHQTQFTHTHTHTHTQRKLVVNTTHTTITCSLLEYKENYEKIPCDQSTIMVYEYIFLWQTYKHFSLSLSLSLRAATKPPPGSYNRDGPQLPLTPSDTRWNWKFVSYNLCIIIPLLFLPPSLPPSLFLLILPCRPSARYEKRVTSPEKNTRSSQERVEDEMFELWPHPLDKLIHVLLKLCYVQ